MRILLYTILVTLLTSSFAPAAMAEYVDGIGLFTKEEFQLRPIKETTEILEQFQKETPEKNVIIYVHGRGKKTSAEWGNLAFMEKAFNARILMFHWQSWGGSAVVRPTEAAAEASSDLSEVFKQIKAYKESNPEVFANKKITLLAHSMGNVVFRDYMEKFYKSDLNDLNGKLLFDSFVSTGADVGLTDHKEWFSKIDFAQKKFVTVNNRDIVLTLSYMLDLKAMRPKFYKLGLGFRNLRITKKMIADLTVPDTTYIDLSKSLRSDHRYFEPETELLTSVFKPLLNGEDFDPESLGVKYKHFNGNMFYIND
jgi:esterase/lipase superfamily enzyme